MIDQLRELSEIAPDICQYESFQSIDYDGKKYIANVFHIGEYRFHFQPVFGFTAHFGSSQSFTGRPALAWLRDALEQAIETRGWEYRTELSQGLFFIQIWLRPGGVVPIVSFSAADKTAALLTALIAAVRE